MDDQEQMPAESIDYGFVKSSQAGLNANIQRPLVHQDLARGKKEAEMDVRADCGSYNSSQGCAVLSSKGNQEFAPRCSCTTEDHK